MDIKNQPINLAHIQVEKPSQNGYVERFTQSYRTEVLEQARLPTLACMWIYNNELPQNSTGYQPPIRFWDNSLDPADFSTLQKDENLSYKFLALNVAN